MDDPTTPLAGRVAIVTGGASGIGAATCRRLARAGASVAAWDLDSEGAARVAEEIAEAGGRAAWIRVDVASPDAVAGAVAESEQRLGPVAILVNCAGTRDITPTLELTPAAWRRVVGTDLDGSFYCLVEVARAMVHSGTHGSIVNVSSITGLRAVPNQVAYIASKSGVIGLTRSAALDLGRHGIRVNAIAPGHILTPLTAPNVSPGLRRHLDLAIPAGRSGSAEEVAEVILFLSSDASSYVSGEVIVVDGGWTVGVSIPVDSGH